MLNPKSGIMAESLMEFRHVDRVVKGARILP